jgi:hypothetical protein
MSKTIKFYREGDLYGEFSNFAKYPVTIDGQLWPTTEHYFQAKKFTANPEYQEVIRTTSSCMVIKKLGGSRKYKLREDWEDVKEGIMYKALQAKFDQYPKLKEILLSTEDSILVEHTHLDKYWADGGDGSGKNRLGHLLMQLRTEIKKIL